MQAREVFGMRDRPSSGERTVVAASGTEGRRDHSTKGIRVVMGATYPPGSRTTDGYFRAMGLKVLLLVPPAWRRVIGLCALGTRLPHQLVSVDVSPRPVFGQLAGSAAGPAPRCLVPRPAPVSVETSALVVGS